MEAAKFLLSVELCEAQHYLKRRVVLFKRVDWPAAPIEGQSVFMGVSDDGEGTGFSATVRSVHWESNGQVDVETSAQNLGDEYEDILADLLRDGFAECPA